MRVNLVEVWAVWEATDPVTSLHAAVWQFHNQDLHIHYPAQFLQVTLNAFKWDQVDVISPKMNKYNIDCTGKNSVKICQQTLQQ